MALAEKNQTNKPATGQDCDGPSAENAQTGFGYSTVAVEEKPGLVQDHFDSSARRYDLMNSLMSLGVHHRWRRTAVRMMGLKPGDRVLDVCGGTADLSILAARAIGPEGRVTLYDFNRSMMEVGKPKVVRASLSDRIRYVQGDAQELALENGQFDAAMVGFGIRNVVNPERGFEEMRRVLKPGGKLMCLEFSRPTWAWFRWLYELHSFLYMPLVLRLFGRSMPSYTYLPESIRTFPLPDELSATLERIGFTDVTFRRLTNGISVVHVGTKTL
jgi:demethylmenaquinone methyltransferase/2-methoxy-6-polyprenyl-1,4-benzoquinol methylase